MSPTNEKPSCRAVALLKAWMNKEDLDTAKVARRLDVSWETVKRIKDDGGRPGVDVVLKLHDMAKIPLDAWRLS